MVQWEGWEQISHLSQSCCSLDWDWASKTANLIWYGWESCWILYAIFGPLLTMKQTGSYLPKSHEHFLKSKYVVIQHLCCCLSCRSKWYLRRRHLCNASLRLCPHLLRKLFVDVFQRWCPEVLPRCAFCVELEEEVPFSGEVGQHSLIPASSRSPSSTTTAADAEQQQQYWSCFFGTRRLCWKAFFTAHQGTRLLSGSWL